MCIAAAIAGAAVIGAAGTAIAGSEAAGATKDASNAAIAEQNKALSEQAQLSAPYRGLGEAAIPTLEGLLGLNPSGSTGGASGVPAVPGQPGRAYAGGPGGPRVAGPGVMSVGMLPGGAGPASGGAPGAGLPGGSPEAFLAATPGYQFAKEQGLDATKNAAAASGMLLSGNTLEGLDRFSTGLADQTYQQQIGNFENVVGMGQAAAAGQAANIGNAATNIGNTLINQGNTIAGIDANVAAGITKSVGNAANQYTTYQTLQALNS